MNPDMRLLLTAIITALTSSGFMTLVVYLLQRSDKKREKREANNTAQSRMLLGLGHDKIIYLTDKYVRRGALTLKEKRNLKFLCDPYFDLGGNGDADIGYKACQELPVVSDEKAEEMDEHIRRREYGFEAD